MAQFRRNFAGRTAGRATHLDRAWAAVDQVVARARFRRGIEDVLNEFGLGWHVTQLGCRAEYRFQQTRPANGTEADQAADSELERYFHLPAMNRGVLITPFHNMALMSPVTSEADVDRHTAAFRDAVSDLLAGPGS
jgi:glutamate-1-semialdehyde 2,1-aminomutase